MIGPPATMLHVPPTVVGSAGHGIGIVAFGHLDDAFDFGLQVVRDSFVSIDRQDPLIRGVLECAVFLRSKAGPVGFVNVLCVFLADGHRLVGTAGIQDDDFICPGNRRQALANRRFFVFNNDDNR